MDKIYEIIIKQCEKFEYVRSRLIIKLYNFDKIVNISQDCVYKTVGDIALTVCLLISLEDSDDIITVTLPNTFLSFWNKREGEIFEDAFNNTYRLMPPRIYNLRDMIFTFGKTDGEDFMSPYYFGELDNGVMGNMLSTTKKINGAVAVFLPGVAKKLAEMLNADFYIVFTSIHEAMIHAVTYIDPYDLKGALIDTMRECTPEYERLTSKIYKYISNENKFICVTD